MLYPDSGIAKHTASNSGEMEWFRPTEVAWYGDVQADGGITHARPLSDNFQRRVSVTEHPNVGIFKPPKCPPPPV